MDVQSDPRLCCLLYRINRLSHDVTQIITQYILPTAEELKNLVPAKKVK